MNSQLNFQIANERIADLHRRADATRHAAEAVEEPQHTPVIALRVAGPDEADELVSLARLDSARPLVGDSLVALVDGKLVAAISLSDGRVIADPLAPTAHARDLLHTRAAQLANTPRRPWRRFRPRFRPRFA
jgi:hypothetical protein